MNAIVYPGFVCGEFVAVRYVKTHNWLWRCQKCGYEKKSSGANMRQPNLHTCKKCHAPPLTPAEMKAAKLIAEGLTNKEIARTLDINADNLKIRLTGIYAKLNLTGRVQLAVWYYKHSELSKQL